MVTRCLLTCASLFLGPAATVVGQATTPGPAPRVILFIGDGVGAGYWTAARVASETLSVARLPVQGLVDTRSASGGVIESAASATAYATGVHTFPGAIAVGMDSLPLRTVLEDAEAQGMATGLVATSSLTHATPAAFAAHVPRRSMHLEIARQIATADIEVLLGGGRIFFDRLRPGEPESPLARLRRRYTYVESGEALRELGADTVKALLGLFAADGMPPAPKRHPTLPEMTRAALALLDRSPTGFFLMVEGSQPDWRGHENAPLEAVTAEMLDFDRAIGAGLEYRARRPETLILVVADHDTGGLTVAEDSTGMLVARYTTISHTALLVPLFAVGPGAERFTGIQNIDAIGRLLKEAVRPATH